VIGRESKPPRPARAIRATIQSPLGRLGKHGTCRRGQEGPATLKVGRATSKTAHYRGVSMFVKRLSFSPYRPDPAGRMAVGMDQKGGTMLGRVLVPQLAYTEQHIPNGWI